MLQPTELLLDDLKCFPFARWIIGALLNVSNLATLLDKNLLASGLRQDKNSEGHLPCIFIACPVCGLQRHDTGEALLPLQLNVPSLPVIRPNMLP